MILCICLDEEKKEISLFDFMNSLLSLIFYLHLLIILQSTQNFTSVSAHADFEEESEIMSFIRKFSKSQTPARSIEVPESNFPNEVTGKFRFMH